MEKEERARRSNLGFCGGGVEGQDATEKDKAGIVSIKKKVFP